jgi:3-isopropylmalate/(R)-2-methylmalate dehydratase large subunit
MQFSGNILFFSTRLDAVQTQLAGKAITLAQALPLRDDVSTDEITPLQVAGPCSSVARSLKICCEDK